MTNSIQLSNFKIQIHWEVHLLPFCSFKGAVKYLKSNTFLMFFIKTSSCAVLFCASSVQEHIATWIISLITCVGGTFTVRSNVGTGFIVPYAPQWHYLKMMMTVINWSWWPTTDKTCMGFVLLANEGLLDKQFNRFQLDHCDVTSVIK